MTAVSVDQVHVILDFSTPGTLQVVELYVLSIPGQKALVVQSDGSNIPFIKLPAGAANASYQVASGSAPIIGTGNGFALVPLSSGQNYDMLAQFELPYSNSLDVTLPFVLPVDSASVLSPEGVRVQSSQLTDTGPQTIQGATYQVYSAQSLAAGDFLAMTISGTPSASPNGSSTAPRTGLIVSLGAFGLVLIGAGVYLFLRDRNSRKDTKKVEERSGATLENDPDRVTDAILLLDDQFKAGEIPMQDYTRRRSELKERLRNLLSGG